MAGLWHRPSGTGYKTNNTVDVKWWVHFSYLLSTIHKLLQQLTNISKQLQWLLDIKMYKQKHLNKIWNMIYNMNKNVLDITYCIFHAWQFLHIFLNEQIYFLYFWKWFLCSPRLVLFDTVKTVVLLNLITIYFNFNIF